MNPTELIVRHSFAPNRLRYCGATDLSDRIPAFIRSHDPDLERQLQNGLQSFKGLIAYLDLIAREIDAKPFSPGVGEAYWIGNELLSRVRLSAIEHLFETTFARDDYLGPELAAEARARLNPDFCVHHSFHVFFTHFITDAVPATIANLNRCRIAPARVLEIRSRNLLTEYRPVAEHDGRLYFAEPEELEIENAFDEPIAPNDWVSVHWNVRAMTLSREQKENLDRFTKKNIDALNALNEK